MRSDIDDLAEETLFALEEEAAIMTSGGRRPPTQARGTLLPPTAPSISPLRAWT